MAIRRVTPLLSENEVSALHHGNEIFYNAPGRVSKIKKQCIAVDAYLTLINHCQFVIRAFLHACPMAFSEDDTNKRLYFGYVSFILL